METGHAKGPRMTAAQTMARAVEQSASVAEVLMGPGVLDQAGALFRRHFGLGPACLLADDATWAAAGEKVQSALMQAGIASRVHVFPSAPRLKPTLDLAQEIASILARDGSTPVAIGSGVLNDVVKHAAFSLSRPYLCVATAASMDGYSSAGAPLSVKGFKMTIACRPAKAILADFDVICKAPREMTGWGYGDLAGKVPAGADWILADALGIEAIDPAVWPMVQGDLRAWLSQPKAVASGDRQAIEGLFAGLTLVGLAMERHGTSRPASGADHQIAHLWEMDDLHFGGERVSHGACVAVGCVMTLRLWDWLLAQNLGQLDIAALVAAAPDMDAKTKMIHHAFGNTEIAARSIEETRAKQNTAAELRARLTSLVAQWPNLRRRLSDHLMPADQMCAALHKAGAPSDASQIGVSQDNLRRTLLRARFLRSRYTVLDVLEETGLLNRAVDAALDAQSQRPPSNQE